MPARSVAPGAGVTCRPKREHSGSPARRGPSPQSRRRSRRRVRSPCLRSRRFQKAHRRLRHRCSHPLRRKEVTAKVDPPGRVSRQGPSRSLLSTRRSRRRPPRAPAERRSPWHRLLPRHSTPATRPPIRPSGAGAQFRSGSPSAARPQRRGGRDEGEERGSNPSSGGASAGSGSPSRPAALVRLRARPSGGE
jgi:hypothetical protein